MVLPGCRVYDAASRHCGASSNCPTALFATANPSTPQSSSEAQLGVQAAEENGGGREDEEMRDVETAGPPEGSEAPPQPLPEAPRNGKGGSAAEERHTAAGDGMVRCSCHYCAPPSARRLPSAPCEQARAPCAVPTRANVVLAQVDDDEEMAAPEPPTDPAVSGGGGAQQVEPEPEAVLAPAPSAADLQRAATLLEAFVSATEKATLESLEVKP